MLLNCTYCSNFHPILMGYTMKLCRIVHKYCMQFRTTFSYYVIVDSNIDTKVSVPNKLTMYQCVSLIKLVIS